MQIITTHKATDFDGLASVVAGTLIYPEAIPVIPKNMNPNVKGFVSIHKDLFDFYTPAEIELARVTRLVVVDTNSWQRLEGLTPLKDKKDLEIHLWDHHKEGDIQAHIKCREEMGATITLLVRQLKKERKMITPIQATLFLIGLYEDTGNLTFTSTSAEDAAAASYLLDRKADLTILSSFLQQVYGEKQKDILFTMLTSSDRMKVKGHIISINTVCINGFIGNLSIVVHMYREIMNVDAAFGIFEDTDKERCIVIGRSHTDDLNIGSIMRSLGGGGHPGAGSAMLKKVKPATIKQMLVDMINGNQQSSVHLGDLMSYPVITVPADMIMEEVAVVLRDKGCTGVPVIENGEIIGMISRRDFRKVRNGKQLSAPVKAFMSPNVICIEPTKSPMDAARIMIKHDIGRIPVVEEGRLIGIVTRSDAMMYFYDLLPD